MSEEPMDVVMGPEPEDPPALIDVADPNEGDFRWVIENWTSLNEIKLRSEKFEIGGFNWQLLLYPRGNNQDSVSVYLAAADADILPYGWNQQASFVLTLEPEQFSHETEEEWRDRFIAKDSSHNFDHSGNDWGFGQFIPLRDMDDQRTGLVSSSDSVSIHIKVKVRKDASSWNYDSRKETGFVGLKNQGATCYMNSLLQTLFHLPYFRKAVYHMPTTEAEEASSSIPLALQSLLYKVQVAPTAVATKDLTRSFGWDAYDSFLQHDVQELNRVLCDKLEEKMKGTSVEGTIQKLFQGHTVNYINCCNVEFKSERKESFLDLQLDVKGCDDVYASFDKYVEVEKMDGDNKYRAEGYGLQDADKGVQFTEFPPVLQLQLKRFEYDFSRDAMVKINDRYAFPETLDLDIGDGKYLTPDADRSVRNLYKLHSVLVHSGGVNGGHYYAFIRPDLSDEGRWFKFDDERVTKESADAAIDDNFGEDDLRDKNGIRTVSRIPKFSNAYMLVYVRESDKAQIVCDCGEQDIAEHLILRLKKEKEDKERRAKEKAEAHLYVDVKLVYVQTAKNQIGSEIFFDLCDNDLVPNMRVAKETTFGEFKQKVFEKTKVPPNRQRYWPFVRRQNATTRPSNVPLVREDEGLTIEQLMDKHNGASANNNRHYNNDENKPFPLFLEVVDVDELERAIDASTDYYEPTAASHAELSAMYETIAPPVPKHHQLLHFKFYDPRNETFTYLGHLLVHMDSTVVKMEQSIRNLAKSNLKPNEPFGVFEEIRSDGPMIDRVDFQKPLSSGDAIGSGDILCLQPVVGEAEYSVNGGTVNFPDVDQFLHNVKDRRRVIFRDLKSPRDDNLTLDLVKTMSYDDVCLGLSGALKVADPTTLRLTQHNSYSNSPKFPNITYRGVPTLADMLTLSSHRDKKTGKNDILYYEVLDMPLPELERLKSFRVGFHGADTKRVDTVNVRVPIDANISDMLRELRNKLGSKVNEHKKLRFFETYQSRIYKIWPGSKNLNDINDAYWVYRAEEVPEDELEFGDSETILQRSDDITTENDDSFSENITDHNPTTGDLLIHVYHFYRDEGDRGVEGNDSNATATCHNFGDPFLLKIGANETLGEIKKRAQKKLGIDSKEFVKWKWGFHAIGRTSPLSDDTIVAPLFGNRKDAFGTEESYLGMEHPDINPRKTAAAKNRTTQGSGFVHTVKIYG